MISALIGASTEMFHFNDEVVLWVQKHNQVKVVFRSFVRLVMASAYQFVLNLTAGYFAKTIVNTLF